MELVLEVHETLGGGMLSHLQRIQERWNQLSQEGQEGIGNPIISKFSYKLTFDLKLRSSNKPNK